MAVQVRLICDLNGFYKGVDELQEDIWLPALPAVRDTMWIKRLNVDWAVEVCSRHFCAGDIADLLVSESNNLDMIRQLNAASMTVIVRAKAMPQQIKVSEKLVYGSADRFKLYKTGSGVVYAKDARTNLWMIHVSTAYELYKDSTDFTVVTYNSVPHEHLTPIT